MWQLAGFSRNTINAMLECVDSDQRIIQCDSHTENIYRTLTDRTHTQHDAQAGDAGRLSFFLGA